MPRSRRKLEQRRGRAFARALAFLTNQPACEIVDECSGNVRQGAWEWDYLFEGQHWSVSLD